MADVLQSFVSEAKKNKYSVIGHSSMSDDDVTSVWDNVSAFIDKQMSQQKGVLIPGLGTFTFSQKKLDVGNSKYLLIQRPIFIVSEKFAATHGLTCSKHHTTGQIPVVQLNYSALSFESPFNRDTVETCVREVVNAVSRSIANKRNVEFMFNGIGRLQIRDSKIKMRFYKDFINSMDGSGRLMDMLRDRPGTLDSVMSDRPPSRSVSHNTLILPRIVKPTNVRAQPDGDTARSPAMPTIQEEDSVKAQHPINDIPTPAPAESSPVNATNNNTDEQMLTDMTDMTNKDILDLAKELGDEYATDAKLEDSDPCQNNNDLMPNDLDLFDLEHKDDILKKSSPPPSVPASRQSSRMSLQLPKAAAVSFADDLIPSVLASPKPQSACSMRRSLSPINLSHSATPRLEGTSKLPEGFDFVRSKTLDKIHLDKPLSPLNNGFVPTPPPPLPKDKAKSPLGSSCGHQNAGQELCYLCHQRDRRNIPVSFTEERKKREAEEDRLLQQYQQLKDVEAIYQEQEQMLGKRHEQQKTAAFNLGVSEAVKQKKDTRDIGFYPSYVFQKRPLTPPRFLKQEEYYKELADQVSNKVDKSKKRKADEEFLERLEQVQLAEDLAAQREQYLRDKNDQREQYKRALSAQVRFKPLPIPARVPDSSEPIFGKNDMTNEGLYEKRRRANELFKEQVESVEQKKRDAILRRLTEQKEEETMLDRNKSELREDRANKYERLFKARRQLEGDWFQAMETKKLREAEDRIHARNPGNLLLDQIDQHKRCGQCKRKMNNTGESNIWRESRYIPGSRLIV